MAFTPWTTLGGYCALLQTIDRLRLVDHVAPIQLSIRLLIPEGSRLLELEDIRNTVGAIRSAQPDVSVAPRRSRVSTRCNRPSRRWSAGG